MTTYIPDYTILNLALSECLKAYWQEEVDALQERYTTLSTQRAGELIAAYYGIRAAREWSTLEQEVREATIASPATSTYDDLVDRSIREELADMSKSRTIIADMDKIEQAERRCKPAYLWEALHYVAYEETHS